VSNYFWIWQLEELLLLIARLELRPAAQRDAAAIERFKRVTGAFFLCLVVDWKGPKEG